MSQTNLKTLVYALTAVAAAVPTLAMADWPTFTLYPISGIGHGPTEALAVNSFSEIAGFAQQGSNTLDFTGLFGGAGYTSQFSGLPNGWTSVEFSGINDDLYMVGSANISGHPTAVGAQYNGNIVNMTAGIPYSYFSQVLGVNHHGDAVGMYNQEATSGVVTHMFRWSSVSTSRTADTINLLPGGINELGTVVASNLKPTNYYQLAELELVPPSGPATITTAPGDYLYIYPSGISTYGGVTTIGQTYLQEMNNSNTHLDGYAYNVAADQWQVLDAPNNPFYESNALAVDVWGQKIAGSTVDPNGLESATVWQYTNGQWVASYLSDLLQAGPTWQFTEATGINTYGAISGWGRHYENGNWVERGFVATPKAFFHVVLPEGSIFGGEILNPAVHVNGQSPFNANFYLTTDSPNVQVPREVTVPGLESSEPFQMETQGVDSVTTANVKLRLGGIESTQTITLNPAALVSMTLTGNTDEGGGKGSLKLRGTAGPSGATIALASSDPSIVVPSTATIPAGSSTANFRIALGRRARVGLVVTITATYRNASISQPFTVN
jgi:hypothetical protein